VLQCVVANWAELRLADSLSEPSVASVCAFRKPGNPFANTAPKP